MTTENLRSIECYPYTTVSVLISVCDTQAASASAVASTPNASRAQESSPNAAQSSGALSLSPIAQSSMSLLPGLLAQDVELFEVALTKGPTGLGITIGGYVIDDPVHNGIPAPLHLEVDLEASVEWMSTS